MSAQTCAYIMENMRMFPSQDYSEPCSGSQHCLSVDIRVRKLCFQTTQIPAKSILIPVISFYKIDFKDTRNMLNVWFKILPKGYILLHGYNKTFIKE